MSAEKALLDAYSEWHRLAEAEGRAIRLRDWNFLLECQQALKKIQPLITRLTREARNEWKQPGADFMAKEKNINAVVSKLIELGRRNQALLKAAREAAQSKREELEQTRRNLKRLQLSYVSARTPAWTSFS
ncbi:MAG TPA: hypothetical protein VGH42_01630 [Verrucomicrobiae bacterium]|jgi:hypothetical protein